MFFKHLAIVTKEFEASIHFYEALTHLQVQRRQKYDDGEIAFLTNADGETEIELISMPSMQNFEGKGLFLCFVTEDLDGMHAYARDNGYTPSDIRNPDPKSRYFYVYDPNGVSVQLKQKMPL